ncbi:GrpB family protein [Paenibacillus dendritiformis]|uniref:GrpB family protein n=1 Tax=Paenibacillus dendritiformis TaxID=130049 RepID=UPI00248CF13E|nr:GrpB family protein [Paenibacillus dendritiformis]WGU97637.1 GrpB family protein [Paenibacillus dendritiformis]
MNYESCSENALTTYNVTWTEEWEIEFKEEERKIRSEINDSILATHHIGSTTIQGLSAKPIIDIAIEIKLFEEEIHCVPGLVKIGYS